MGTRTVTVRPTEDQALRWSDAAIHYNRSIPAFLAFATDWTIRYLRETERRKKPDTISRRLTERELIGILVRAARLASDHLPRFIDSPIYGRLPVGKDLTQAIRNLQEFLAETGEEYGT